MEEPILKGADCDGWLKGRLPRSESLVQLTQQKCFLHAQAEIQRRKASLMTDVCNQTANFFTVPVPIPLRGPRVEQNCFLQDALPCRNLVPMQSLHRAQHGFRMLCILLRASTSKNQLALHGVLCHGKQLPDPVRTGEPKGRDGGSKGREGVPALNRKTNAQAGARMVGQKAVERVGGRATPRRPLSP